MTEVNQTLHDKWLEQFERHLLGQTALMQLELRTNHDHGTAGVVNTLTQKVLAETTLLALEHVRERLQCPVTWTGDRATTATVVKERVNSFLQHALFVIDDDLRSTKIKQTLETVVAVDHATVEIIEIARCETTTIKLNHGTQIRWNNWNCIKHHAHRGIGGVAERIH